MPYGHLALDSIMKEGRKDDTSMMILLSMPPATAAASLALGEASCMDLIARDLLVGDDARTK